MNETTELIMKQLNSKKVHAETHELGGGDEIDALKLKNIGSVTAKTISDPVTSSMIAMGAVGVNQLDPSLITEVDNVAVQAEFDKRGINVQKFGAKGDGITDDTSAFNDVLTALASYGTGSVYNRPVVFMPPGKFVITSSLTIQSMQNVRFIGSGIDASTILFTGTGALFHLGVVQSPITNYWSGNAQGFQIEHCTIRYEAQDNMASNGSRTVNGIQDNGSGGAIVKNVRFRGFKNGYFGKHGSDFSKIEDCAFMNCDIGAYLGPGSQQVELFNNNFFLCNESIVMERANQGRIDNCWFIDNYLCDISVEANTTMRYGQPILSGVSNDLSWMISSCWFETGAGYNTNADHQYHILFKGDTADATPRGVKILKPVVVAGTTGMGTKDGSKKYSFVRVEQGTYFKVEDLIISGTRLDCVADMKSGVFPSFLQINTRTQDGYTTVPLWNNQADGCVSYGFLDQILSARTNNCYYELDNDSSGQKVKFQLNSDGTLSFILWDGSGWRERVKFDIASSMLKLGNAGTGDQIIRFANAMPTSGTYRQGDIVFNNGTDTTIVLWKRLTTGSAHVLNTDWKVASY